MVPFMIKRLLRAIAMLFAVLTIVFFVVHMMPSDPALMMLGGDNNVNQEALAKLREEMGLNKPILQQYKDWIFHVMKGDLGHSYSERNPVWASISSRLPRTLELAGVAILLACLMGIPLGILSALRQEKPTDFITTSLASLGNSLPVYVLGYLLVIVFSLDVFQLGFKMPSSGYTDFHKDAVKHIARLILPAFTLALGIAASITRMTRSSVLDALASESVRALRAKGLPEYKIIGKHVIRNALIPVVTIIGLQFGNLIGGTVLCETVFNWPGLSTLLVKAINQRDYPLIQGCILVMSSIFILANLLVDLLYGLLDPRAR